MHTVTHEDLQHDLRTPLTSVLGYSATLLDRWDELGEGDRMEFIRIVYGEALRMAQSIEQLDRHLYHQIARESAHSGEIKAVANIADAS